MDITTFFHCSNCNCHLEFAEQAIIEYFDGDIHHCPKCQHSESLFDTVQKRIEENFFTNAVFTFVSAESKLVQFTLKPQTTFELDFVSHGLPETARILFLNYTPCGELFPVEKHGNNPLGRQNTLKRYLWPMENGKDPSKISDTQVNCMVTWVDQAKESYDGIKELVDAAEYYKDGHYEDLVIPANVSVELPLTRLVSKIYENNTSKSCASNLLDVATYSHQLNALFPYICEKEGYPKINDEIRGTLNRLRKLRNEIAHSGRLSSVPDKKEVAKILTSSLFVNRLLNNIFSQL